MALASMAVAEFGHFSRLRDRLSDLGADPFASMEPFHAPVDAFHAHTAPSDWLESLIKAYVGDGLAADFYREIATYLDPETRDLILATLDDTGQSQFAVDRVRKAIEANPKIAGRLALWARRLMGEALSQAQRVAAERDALSTLLVGGVDRPGWTWPRSPDVRAPDGDAYGADGPSACKPDPSHPAEGSSSSRRGVS